MTAVARTEDPHPSRAQHPDELVWRALARFTAPPAMPAMRWDALERPGASSITRRGRWARYLKVRATRPTPGSSELRIIGSRSSLRALLGPHRIYHTLLRSPRHRWRARAYFAYVTQFGGVRGRGGLRALAYHAAREWPEAPFAWSLERTGTLVQEGRGVWAARLAEAGIIPPGRWWEA